MARKRNKRMLSYYAWYRKVRTPKFKQVAVMHGSKLETTDPVFIKAIQVKNTLKLENPPLLSENRLRFNVVDKNNDRVIAKVDKALNIYTLNDEYVGTLYNQFKIILRIIAWLVISLAVILLGFASVQQTGFFTHAKDVIISEVKEGQANIVTEEFNILVDPYGNKLIAPGRATSYYFNLISENYTDTYVNLTFDEVNEANIPMRFRLISNGEYLVGSANEWVSIDELYAYDLCIKAYEEESFRLDWIWVDNDGFDTALGIKGTDTYTIKFTVESFFK
ncbi:MAG: hypothetical protein IKC22_05250 [Bacilli bacterium]|nr:hypothetical protein [Bacilli bacterium]